MTLAHKPGQLGEAGVRLGQANIKVEYAYASLVEGGKKTDVVPAVSDLAGARKAWRGL